MKLKSTERKYLMRLLEADMQRCLAPQSQIMLDYLASPRASERDRAYQAWKEKARARKGEMISSIIGKLNGCDPSPINRKKS